ncbi:MAG: efflux RND transporter periplasmic adaptor subunit [Proteobacteria bacterium]|nr:efflux RND transporter periplasmic adaptor subunit [Pseudomonadota bacterium]
MILRNPIHLSGLLFACIILAAACTGKKVDLPPSAPEVTTDISASRADASPPAPTSAPSAVPPAAQPQPATKNVIPAERKAATEPAAETLTRVSGQVNSGKQGQASFKTAGHISKTIVQVGEKVRKGQILALLDDTDARLRFNLARNQLEQASVTFEQANKDMQREEQLKKEGATTQTNLERISNALAAARIGRAQAQINLQQAEKNLNDTKLAAAFDGVVARRLKVEGEYVGVGAAVFELASMKELEVSLRVPETLIRKVKPGHVVSLSIPSLGRSAQAKILRIVPVIQENSRTFEVIGRVGDALSDDIIPGQFVEAQL